jgi:hypothetical protein
MAGGDAGDEGEKGDDTFDALDAALRRAIPWNTEAAVARTRAAEPETTSHAEEEMRSAARIEMLFVQAVGAILTFWAITGLSNSAYTSSSEVSAPRVWGP